MRPQRLDAILAYKAISLTAELSGTEKRVAAAIIDSFNRKTGQCDPSLGRIAHLLGINRRTVIRAMHRVERVRFIQKSRHGGKSHRNSYEPNWVRFREAEARWNAHQKTKHWNLGETKVSPSGCESCHVAGADAVTQTLISNQSNKPEAAASIYSSRSCKSEDSKGLGRKAICQKTGEMASVSGSISRGAALAAAERRWNTDLNNKYSATPEIYAEVIAAIDAEMQSAATDAEMRRHGAGLDFIHGQLRLGVLKGRSTPIAAGVRRK